MQIKSFLKLASSADVIAIDTETTGVERSDKAFCISLTFQTGKKFNNIAIVHEELKTYFKEIKALLEQPDSRKVFHNARFDLFHLSKLGFDVPISTIDDTMVIAHLLYPEGSKKLKLLAKKHLDKKLTEASDKMEEKFKEMGIKNFASIDIDLLKEYAEKDTEITLRIYNYFIDEVGKLSTTRKDQMRYLYKLEMKTLSLLYNIENEGIFIDKKKSLAIKKDYASKAKKHQDVILKIAYEHKIEVNPDSDEDMAKLLEATGFDMSILPRTYKTDKVSMQSKDLKVVADKDKTGLIKAISKYWHYSMHVSMYVDNFLKGEKVKGKPDLLRLYPKFSQTVAQTGRFTSFNPNFQNLPRGPEIRQLIVAPKDYMIVAIDYKQIEVRVLAHCAKDFKLSSVFLEGKDPYNQTGHIIYKVPEEEIAKDIYGKRFICKKVVLGLMYSMGPATMSKVINAELATMKNTSIKKVTLEECKTFINDWFNYYKGANRYRWAINNFAKKYGYVLNIFGRIRQLAYNFSYRGVNTIIQGSTADIIRYKMCQVDKYLEDNKMRKKARLILQVHDELVYYIHKDKMNDTIRKLRDILSDQDIGVCKFSLPLDVDIEYGSNWGNMKDWEDK